MQKSVADADLISKPKRTTKSTIILRVRDSIFTVFRGPCSDTCIPHSAVCCQKFPWCADRLYYSLHAHRHRGCDIDRQLAARPRERLFEAVRSTMDNFSRYRTHTLGSILSAPHNGDGDRTMSDVALFLAGCRGRSYASKAAGDGMAVADHSIDHNMVSLQRVIERPAAEMNGLANRPRRRC